MKRPHGIGGGGQKVCSGHLGHMTKVTFTFIHRKSHGKKFRQNQKANDLEACNLALRSWPIIVRSRATVQMMNLGFSCAP